MEQGDADNTAVEKTATGYQVVVKQGTGPEVGDGSWPATRE